MTPVKSTAGYLDPHPDNTAPSSGSRGPVRSERWGQHLDCVTVPPSGEYFLHPGEFGLAAIHEYIRLPKDLCADVVGRSSWARLGLIIAMATFVHPGYAGCLTLELQNLGQTPIRLKPGLRVAQLIFRETTLTALSDDVLEGLPWPNQVVCSFAPEYSEVIRKRDQELLDALARCE